MAKLVQIEPQWKPNGTLIYVFNGSAVRALLTDLEYSPTDIDTIAFTDKIARRLPTRAAATGELSIEASLSDDCFVHGPLNPKDIEETAEVVQLYPGGPYVVLQGRALAAYYKGSEYPHVDENGNVLWLPRPKDLVTVETILQTPPSPRLWRDGRRVALKALPSDVKADTRARLHRMQREIVHRRRATAS